MEQPIEVVDGIAKYDGQTYYVSNDGEMIIDKDRRLVGYISNGKFVPNSPEYTQKLRDAGMLEGGAK